MRGARRGRRQTLAHTAQSTTNVFMRISSGSCDIGSRWYPRPSSPLAAVRARASIESTVCANAARQRFPDAPTPPLLRTRHRAAQQASVAQWRPGSGASRNILFLLEIISRSSLCPLRSPTAPTPLQRRLAATRAARSTTRGSPKSPSSRRRRTCCANFRLSERAADHHVRGAPGDPSRAARRRRPPAGDRRPVLDPRLRRGHRLRDAPRGAAAASSRDRPRHRDARVFREAAHDGRLEGPHQRSAPRRQLPDQRRPAARAAHPARDQRARAARRHRVPRHDHAAVHRRPDRVGRDRRAHHREPGASRARVRTVVPGRLQERHQRRRAASPSTRSRPRPRRIISCR